VADFALHCRTGRIAVIIADVNNSAGRVEDGDESMFNYLALSGGWRLFRLSTAEIEQDISACARRLAEVAKEMGGIVNQAKEESPST
jgi:hypothetical protein